jgi:molybdopterin/thiamine biosynthesis adenylyltransferase
MKDINVKQSRFRDASWFGSIETLTTPIVVGGAGGIGSWLTLFLSRMLSDNYVFLYDFDNVEEVNMAGQMFGKQHINMPKVNAVQDIVTNFTDFTKLSAQNEKYTVDSLKSPIMFSAFDNMEARKVMFNNWSQEAPKHDNAIFIDGRLLAEQLQVFFVTPETARRYQKDFLFDDSEVEDANCSYKQTSHFAAVIAAKMVQGFTNWFIRDEAELPFYYEEIGSLFLTQSHEANDDF